VHGAQARSTCQHPRHAVTDVGHGQAAEGVDEVGGNLAAALENLESEHAAELAASRGSPALADLLDDLNDRMDRAIRKGGSELPERLQEINARFHRAILDASGSPRLRSILSTLIDMPIVLRSHFISTLQDKVQSLNHHRDLAAAVRAGDGELARQVMQLHLRVASHRFKRQRKEFRPAPSGTDAP
jgi:DNA-binding GntR family transcriptional regulator